MDSMPRTSWLKQTNARWTTHPKRGYVGQIDYAAGPTPYTLTITGTGAPAPSSHQTFKLAKSQFNRFLRTKSV